MAAELAAFAAGALVATVATTLATMAIWMVSDLVLLPRRKAREAKLVVEAWEAERSVPLASSLFIDLGA